MFFGATSPPKDAPYDIERKFVLMWMGFIALIVGWCVLLLYFLGIF